MNKQVNAGRSVMVFGAAVVSLALAAGCATTGSRTAANGPAQDARACAAGVALVNPASQLHGVAPVDGSEASVLNVDSNAVRGVSDSNGYAVRARGAINSDVGRGNTQHCAF